MIEMLSSFSILSIPFSRQKRRELITRALKVKAVVAQSLKIQARELALNMSAK
jgi:hypothetical protein